MYSTRLCSIVLAAALSLLASQAFGQKAEITGTWGLISVTDANSGADDKAWGPAPKGLLVLNETGHFSQHQMRSDRPKYTGAGRLSGTPEDHKRAAEQTLSYFGTYTIDPEKKVISFRYEGSSWPNLEGTEAKREFQISGDELKTFNPAAAGGGAIMLSWRRLK